MILNDGLHVIKENPEEFVENLHAAALRVLGKTPIDIPCGYHSNVAQVVETHHADQTAIVAVGGNCGTNLGYVHGTTHHKPEDKLEIVRRLAYELGYTLRKRNVRKPS